MRNHCGDAAAARIQPARRVKRAQSTIERVDAESSPRNLPARRVNRAKSTIERSAAQPVHRKNRTAPTIEPNEEIAVATLRRHQGT